MGKGKKKKKLGLFYDSKNSITQFFSWYEIKYNSNSNMMNWITYKESCPEEWMVNWDEKHRNMIWWKYWSIQIQLIGILIIC